MNRAQWARCIGNIIISMNEIDWLTHMCKKKIFNEALSKRWLEKALAKRLESLREKITENDPRLELRELKALLAEAHRLCEFRNQIAHGSFVLNCDKPMTADPDSQLEILAIGHEQTIAEEDIRNKAARCREISDGITRQLAIVQAAGVAKRSLTLQSREATQKR